MIKSSREYKPWLDLGMEVQPRARIRADLWREVTLW